MATVLQETLGRQFLSTRPSTGQASFGTARREGMATKSVAPGPGESNSTLFKQELRQSADDHTSSEDTRSTIQAPMVVAAQAPIKATTQRHHHTTTRSA